MDWPVNVVFDLGDVLITCSTDELVAGLFADDDTRAQLHEAVFAHPDWVEFDRGTLSRERAAERAAQRTGLDVRALDELFDALPYALVPDPDVLELARALKGAGNRLFVLSNMHRLSLDHLEEAYDLFALFEARVVSCEVGFCKPEPMIYRELIENFALVPGETVLIDDLEVNLVAAAAQGLRTIQFRGVDQCRTELTAMGCL
jgi:putative hydrolase of the HAD superfamily